MAIDENDLNQPESLSKKVIRGGIWVFSLRIINRSLGFIRTIILARLLAPSDFGLLGIAMLAIATLETFSQTGFQAALIQKKENVESYLDTAWTVSAIRGIVLFLLLLLSAPVIATFFNSPQATLMIKVIAVSTLLSGFRNIGILFFQKELEFNKLFFYELSATLVDLTVAITLAFMLRNVWALVWGGLAANFVRLFMSYFFHSYRPHVRLDKGEFKELFGFGRWVMGSSILFFLITQGDDIFVGKMVGVTALGLYQMAYLISNLPATEITHIISQVTFPAYSKFQIDIPRLREAYLRVLQFTSFMSLPIAGGMFVLAPDFIRIFLGEKWMGMAVAMKILCVLGATRSIGAISGPLFNASGNPQLNTKISFIKLCVILIFIYPFAVMWKITGVAFAVVISDWFAVTFSTLGLRSILNLRYPDFFKNLFPPVIAVSFMMFSITAIKNLYTVDSMFNFLIISIIGMVTYLGTIYFYSKVLDTSYSLQKNLRGLITSQK